MRFTAFLMLSASVACAGCSAPRSPSAHAPNADPRRAQRTALAHTATEEPSLQAQGALGGDGVVTFSARTGRGTLAVDGAGVLTLDDGRSVRVLDRAVIAEVTFAFDGALVAYPRRTELGAELVLRSVDEGQGAVLSAGLSVADRPALSPDGALVAFWGSGGQDTIAGMYVVAASAGAVPRRVNNRGVTIGAAGFVEPPVERTFAFVAPRSVQWRGVDGVHRAEVER